MTKQIRITIALVLALALGGVPALAEGGAPASKGFSAKGSIVRPTAITLLAPMGGQIENFSWSAGDRIDEGATAFAIKPTQVYAAANGIATNLRAQIGDRAQDVANQYGALCYIERQDVWHVDASTSGAYNDPDNRDLRIGQVVRVQHGTGDNKVRGEGTIISIEGKDFVVELAQGDFEYDDSVKLYLSSSKDNASKDQVGSGDIVRAPALGAMGEGVIAEVLVAEGDTVTRGQPLFILDDASAKYGAEAKAQTEVTFPRSAVIGEISVAPGQFVKQGQALMTMLPTDALQASLEVDELDIAKVRVGDTVRVKVDAYAGERTGTVVQIRQLGITVLDTTKYDVRIAFEQNSDLLIGMHTTGYWD